MKLTLEQKRYRKTVVFDNEVKTLQQKIDNLDLSSPLTIKKLIFDYNKSQNHRMLCLIFKEKFTQINSITKKKNHINKWASVSLTFDGSGIKRNGLDMTNVFALGGVVYKDNDKEVEDDDIRKVCEMLANEYFLWIHWTDNHVNSDIEFGIKRHKVNDLLNFPKYNLTIMYERMDRAFDGKYTKYSIPELIDNYNKQVERGLIIDCPFEDGKFPFDNVDDIKVSENTLEMIGIYG